MAEPPPGFAWVERIGPTAPLCVAAPSQMAPGQRLLIHLPGDRPLRVAARVKRPARGAECQAFAQHLAVGGIGKLHMRIAQADLPHALPDMPFQGIAQTSALGRQVHARLCTTSEGAIGTVWQGKPLRSPLLWSGYAYAGMDLVANCTPRDVRAMNAKR